VGGHDGCDDGPPAASSVILLFAAINRRRNEHQGHVRIDWTIPAGLSDGVDGLWRTCHASPVGPAYGGFGFTDDGEHEQSIVRGIAARRRSLPA
jgi:hypothetical protein